MEILKGEDNLCMIAKQDKDGFHWNGVTYANQKELSAAVRLIVGAAVSLSPANQSHLAMLCPTLPITNQRSKGLPEGEINRRNYARKACRLTCFLFCFLSRSGNIVAIFGKAKKKGFKP